MPTAPDLDDAKTYLGASMLKFEDVEIQSALDAETAAQLRACRIPADADPLNPQPYPADLAEALYRRTAHNLALRGLPLGVQASVADGYVATNRVGGLDAEVRRLERPYQRVSVR